MQSLLSGTTERKPPVAEKVKVFIFSIDTDEDWGKEGVDEINTWLEEMAGKIEVARVLQNTLNRSSNVYPILIISYWYKEIL